ncbi:Pseudouridylate synthase 7 homolog-like protein [Seminavis robusta]|uniref:Pseudouridylate synthase 7 homolog-like protein n=1 Tax=Seminavis robusta TaxID=568900 RepID=A0A9N8DB80_9STRA|nr:Pseudouridylate synthase 7 homolog-like protein [Seminavis robusta]|eukprot:Sro42_g025430.1 Pseudouridylate synthase 7 homolog-like protein (890) ;mRNA; f:20324-22993
MVKARHFATIGIEDVFAESPPDPRHHFPKSYLLQEDRHPIPNENDDTANSFVTSEILGVLKERPEDFVVREISKVSRMLEIFGKEFEEANDERKRELQVADLVELGDTRLHGSNSTATTTPWNTDPKESAAKDATSNTAESAESKEDGEKNGQANATATKMVTDAVDTEETRKKPMLSHMETIEAVLGQVLEAQDKIYSESQVKKLVEELQSLHNKALEKIEQLANNPESPSKSEDSPQKEQENVVVLPAVPANFAHLEGSEGPLTTLDRGDFHKALRLAFPMLKATTISSDNDDKKKGQIHVEMDDLFHELIPFLDKPLEDLPKLYRFQKIGCVIDDSNDYSNDSNNNDGNHKNRKRKRDGRQNDRSNNNGRKKTNNGTNPILRLKPTLTKDERRPIHRMLQLKNRAMHTETLSEYPRDEDGDNNNDNKTAAIVVYWDERAKKRARQKYQRSKQQKTGQQQPQQPQSTNIYCVLKKREKEHLTALNIVCKEIKCRTGDVGLAGIKDMKAVTYQFCTIRNCRPGKLRRAANALQGKGIHIGTIREVPASVFLNNGDLQGNNFEITLRKLRRIRVVFANSANGSNSNGNNRVVEEQVPCEKLHIQQMFERVSRSGFVNFFGEQRVGTPGETSQVGVRTFDVGRAMLQGDFDKMIELVMTGRAAGYRGTNNPAEAKVRKVWKDSGGDPAATLKAFPKGENLPRERALMKGLHRYGKGDPLAAIQCIPFNQRKFWINAYQSLVWNFMASARLRKYGATSAAIGDLFLEDDAAGIFDVHVVDSTNVSSVSMRQVVLPLPGYGVQYPTNDIGTLYQEFLQKDKIGFEKKGPDEGTAKGSYRRLIVKAGNMRLATVEDGEDTALASSVKICFDLPSGSYATMLLREMMLTTVARD